MSITGRGLLAEGREVRSETFVRWYTEALESHWKVPLARDVDLLSIARGTPGLVGADRANLVNEAALLAARRNLDVVTQQCFHDALDKILLGAERPLVLSEADVNVIAYHEGGHALTELLLEHVDPVSKVTIVPRGQALGVTQYTPLDDRYNYSQEYLEAQLVTALGGRAAEEVALGSITMGAVSSNGRACILRLSLRERQKKREEEEQR